MFRGMAALCLFGVTVMLRPQAHDVRTQRDAAVKGVAGGVADGDVDAHDGQSVRLLRDKQGSSQK